MPGRKTGPWVRGLLGVLALTLMWFGFGLREDVLLPEDPEPSPSATASSVTSEAAPLASPSSSPTVVGPTAVSVPTQTAPELPLVGESMPVKIVVDTVDDKPAIRIERNIAKTPVRPILVDGRWRVRPPVDSAEALRQVYLRLSDVPELVPAVMPSNPAPAGIYFDGHTCRDRNGKVCDGAFDRLQETEGRPIRIKLYLENGFVLVFDKFWSDTIEKGLSAHSEEFYDGVPGVLHLVGCNLREDGERSTHNYLVKARLVAVERWR